MRPVRYAEVANWKLSVFIYLILKQRAETSTIHKRVSLAWVGFARLDDQKLSIKIIKVKRNAGWDFRIGIWKVKNRKPSEITFHELFWTLSFQAFVKTRF